MAAAALPQLLRQRLLPCLQVRPASPSLPPAAALCLCRAVVLQR